MYQCFVQGNGGSHTEVQATSELRLGGKISQYPAGKDTKMEQGEGMSAVNPSASIHLDSPIFM